MDQVVEVQSQPDAASVHSVQSSSVDVEETTLIQDLWRRVSRMGPFWAGPNGKPETDADTLLFIFPESFLNGF